MRFADLPRETVEQIRRYRYDRIVEMHEGPERWEAMLAHREPEFISLAGYDVLLPIDREQLANVTLLRAIASEDGLVLTIFLRDTTFGQDWYDSGFLAICEKLPGQEFFLATVYHEWFVIENP